jgi:membrane associated rhomboid family serine protease
MDLNHILLFVAFLSPIALIARSRRTAEMHRGWRTASVAVLIVTGGAWFFFPRAAGFIGGGAWFALLLLPAIISRKIADLTLRERFAAARQLVTFLRILHPADGVPEQTRLLRALEIAQRGETPRALDLLATLHSDTRAIGRQAMAQTFRLRGDWEGLIAWVRTELLPNAWQREAVLPLYFRALGETHRLDELALQLAARNQVHSENALKNLPSQLSLLALWAFNGNKAQLVRLFETSLRKMSGGRKTFWLATCDLTSGELESGRTKLVALQSQTGNAILRSEIIMRLDHASDYADALRRRAPETDRILQRLQSISMKPAPYAGRIAGATPVVITLIVLNVAMFFLEILSGGSTNPLTLHRLGQLETSDFFVRREYWRLLTSLFLHYGPIHLLFNLYALYVLGPALERSIGALRFLACYLVSGIGSGLGIVFLYAIGVTRAEEVVGASGCIMGVVGAWAGFLLRYRHAPLARRRLQNIVVIVVIQTVFDLSTPQVSMTAHLCGLITGLVAGLILAPRAHL